MEIYVSTSPTAGVTGSPIATITNPASGMVSYSFTTGSTINYVWINLKKNSTESTSYNIDNLQISTVASPYMAMVVMTSDYYPYGYQMPDRHINDPSYRYGYNGMEKNAEMYGEGNEYSTEFRQYDPRLGRWMSLDPLMAEFPDVSPYVAFGDNPIFFTDPEGLKPRGKADGDKKQRVRRKDRIKVVETREVDHTVEENPIDFTYKDNDPTSTTFKYKEAKTLDGEWICYEDDSEIKELKEKRTRKIGFHVDSYFHDAFEKHQKPTKAFTVIQIDMGNYKKRLLGGDKEKPVFDPNPRQKDRYTIRANRHNERVLKKLNIGRLEDNLLDLGDLIGMNYKGYAYKYPLIYSPTFAIKVFHLRGTAFYKRHKRYNRGRLHKKAKDIRIKTEIRKGINPAKKEEDET
ncbi:MAG: RHS repeat-associated core domain-containing protein [Fluviicola sp.]